jgi:hypothetical protein
LPSDVFWKDALEDWHFARTVDLPAQALRPEAVAAQGRG